MSMAASLSAHPRLVATASVPARSLICFCWRLAAIKTHRHGAVSSPFFILKQLSTLEASKMELAQSLKASGVHAALCSAVPRFSCANAIVEQDATATSATKTNLYFAIFQTFL
jgi:hypothetical protein